MAKTKRGHPGRSTFPSLGIQQILPRLACGLGQQARAPCLPAWSALRVLVRVPPLKSLRTIRFAGWWLLWLAVWMANVARAHTPSETFLTIEVTATNFTGQWDVALRDLVQGLGLTPEAGRSLPAEDLSRRQEALALDTLARIEIKADAQPLVLQAVDYFPLVRDGIDYARLVFTAEKPTSTPAALALNLRAFFSVDPNLHGLVRLVHGARTEVAAFGKDAAEHRFNLAAPSNRGAQWLTFVHEGVVHIWMGYDHILFLLALLLPAVLRREGAAWRSVTGFRPAFYQVLKVVTAFTLAHSITLSLAALDIVRLPSRLVESVIAASVVLVALNNLRPMFGDKSWLVAFGFGLVHGFGFANVLGELGLPREVLALALVGFNVGVELGQLAIVAVFLPLAYLSRRTWFYQTVTFKFGSAAIILIAAAWMTERVFDLKLMPF